MLSHSTEAIITQFSNVLFCYAIFILIIDEIFCIPPLRIRNVYVMFIELWQWGKQGTNTYTVITSIYSSSLFLIFFGISTSFKEELLFVFFFFLVWWISLVFMLKKMPKEYMVCHGIILFPWWRFILITCTGICCLETSFILFSWDCCTSKWRKYTQRGIYGCHGCIVRLFVQCNCNFFEFVLSIKTIFLNRYLK